MKSHYSEAESLPRLVFLPGWSFHNNGIEKTFEFRDFISAFSFMTRVALEAARLDHHPIWKQEFGRIWIRLTSAEAGGLTDLDFQLAEKVEKRVQA